MNHYDDMSSNLLNSEHDYGKVKLDSGEVVTIATNNYRSLMRNNNVNIRKKVYNLFKENLPPVRNAIIEGESYKVYPNPVTNKLQLVLTSAYFATQDWNGER